jgi:hypothetical protein
MKKTTAATLLLLGSILIPFSASAAPLRVFVQDFSVSSPESSALKNTLKRLLSSRLSGEGINTVDAASEADVVVSGSYTQLGKIFSLDAEAKTSTGKPLGATYEQGDSLDALIPAVGKLSVKLRDEIKLKYPQSLAPAVLRVPAETASSALVKAPAAIDKAPTNIEKAPAAIERVPEVVRQTNGSSWMSQRLEGAQKGVAAAGPKDVFILAGDSLSLYRQGQTLTLLASEKFSSRYRILAVDTVNEDQEGKVLAFVSIMDGEVPASRVYSAVNGSLKLVAKDLSYLFRSLALGGGSKRLYAQELGRIDDYYGDVYEASYADGSVKLKNPIKMPKFGNIFNFNTFRDQNGKSYFTGFTESGYLVVYTDQGKELWRSNDKFGGSETSFQRRDSENERITGTPYRTKFIDQRITVTDQGEVLVPQNGGFFVFGNSRAYSKYSIFCFVWNGSSLEERWRTKQSQNYLADYFYRPATKELVMLEVVQKDDLFGAGASALKVIKTE